MTEILRRNMCLFGLVGVMQLLVSCGGGGGASSGTDDSHTAVANVVSFGATAGNASVSLSWVNPATANFAGVVVRRDLSCPATPVAGTLVADTVGTSAFDTGLSNGTTYCYRAFAYDSNGYYASGVGVYARPDATVTATAYASVAAGGIHTLAIKADGTLWAWGAGDWGQLGNGCDFYLNCYIDQRWPKQVGTDSTWKIISGGTVHSAALKKDGSLWAWGDNSSGQIGTGCNDSSCFYYSTPTQTGTDKGWVSLSTGGFFTTALKSDGTLWSWGDNYAGVLGDGCAPKSSCVDRAVPTQIGTETDWAMVAAGGNHVLALKTNGTLWAWGSNYDGQIGNGVPGYDAYVSTPLQIGTDTGWRFVAAGDMHSLAIKSNGTLWAWGHNNAGQLGVTCSGSCPPITVPTQVGSDTDWKEVDGGFALTMATKTDGTVWAWGNFSSSTGSALNVPTRVGSWTSWSKVSAGGGGGFSGTGGGHFMGFAGEYLMGWGTNMYGQLGIGTASPVWNPSKVN